MEKWPYEHMVYSPRDVSGVQSEEESFKQLAGAVRILGRMLKNLEIRFQELEDRLDSILE